jgi:CO dehydrogenase maturation factor
LLGELEHRSGRVVVADLEAGVGTISRLHASSVDRLVLVVEPYAKSVEVGRRALAIAAEIGIVDVVVVASRIRDDEDIRTLEGVFGVAVLAVPEDPAVRDADREGVAPIDHAPGSPAVNAIGVIADALLGSAA